MFFFVNVVVVVLAFGVDVVAVVVADVVAVVM